MTGPGPIALAATPGIEEIVSSSPIAIGPFSNDTCTGTRPTKATGTTFSGPSVGQSERYKPGLVEITPIIEEVAEVARII